MNDFEPKERQVPEDLTVTNQDHTTHRSLYHNHNISIIQRPCLIFLFTLQEVKYAVLALEAHMAKENHKDHRTAEHTQSQNAEERET